MNPRTTRAFWLLFAVLYSVGLVGHLVSWSQPLMLAMTPWFLLLSGIGVLMVFAWKTDGKSLALWLVPFSLVTFGLEVLGVATGWIFGAYSYSEVLGTRVAGVPPVIGWNWALVVLGLHTASRRFLSSPWLRIGFVALACVAFDALLEPVAMNLGYWTWVQGTVPIQNYVAWGLIAALGAWWAERFPRISQNSILGIYVAIQAVFFLGLSLFGTHG